MALITRIKQYIDSKSNELNAHNSVKSQFFTEILNLEKTGFLNVANLTKAIAVLEEEELHKLFYYGRKWGNNFKEKASANSKAGQLILELYKKLGAPLKDKHLELFIKKGISEKNKNYLNDYHYQNWLKNPLSRSAINKLEHELKGLLGNSQANFSLAQTLNLEKGHLTLLLEKASAYFPEVIHQRFQFANPPEKKELIKFIIDKVKRNNSLGKTMAEINVELAAALVQEGLQDYFALSPSMQDAVFTFFHQTENRKALENLRQQFWSDEDSSVLQRINRQQFIELLDQGDRHYAANKNNNHNQTFKQIIDKVYELAILDPAQAYAQLQINDALQAIRHYISKDPSAYKTEFFNNLAADIKAQGLSVDLLQQYLKQSDRNQLFDKWCGFGGPHSSRAAALMKNLFNLASLDNPINIDETDEMIDKGDLPELRESFVKEAQEKVREVVTYVVLQPNQANNSRIHQTIGKAFDYLKSFQQFFHRENLFIEKHAEAKYQNYLLKKGLELANQQDHPIFDPQGHVLITVSLDEDDYAEILQEIFEVDGAEERLQQLLKMTKKESSNKEKLQKLLGSENLTPTFCNLDIADHKDLHNKFKQTVNNMVVDEFIDSTDRGSVIPLQEEMAMHVTLSLRSLEKFMKAKDQDFVLEEGKQHLMQDINGLVMEKFSAALTTSLQNNKINYELLNKGLDEARKVLAPKCRTLLVKAISDEMSDELFENFQNNLLPNLDDNFFTSTTATGLDYLRTDAKNETVVRISGTEKTAHSKKSGKDEQALRMISRNHYDAQRDWVKPYSQNAIDARVPSIADIDINHFDAIFDVAKKLQNSKDLLSKKLGGYNGPLVYNLLTSLYPNAFNYVFFESNNKQRPSASRILKGSHLYNNWQLNSGSTDSLIYIQNIPVNQHGLELNLHSWDDATAEATLMTELSLLTTFTQHAVVFPPNLQKSIKQTQAYLHANYLKFLPMYANGDHYFKDSSHGKNSIEILEDQKNLWKDSLDMVPATNIQDLCLQALFKMTMTNDYQNKQFGALVQALSIFVEPMSQAGCKSANERYQAVSGRVELLKSLDGMNPENHSEYHKAIVSTLQGYVKGEIKTKKLQAAVDIAYNKHNLYGASIFSAEDQGAGSKVKATKNKKNPGEISEINTNYAETNFLTRLFQEFAASMQAHKAKLTKEFTKLFSEVRAAAKSSLSM